MFVLFQVALESNSLKLQSLESANYAFVRESIKGSEASKSSIVCLGDSLVKLGVSPLVVQQYSKEPVFNLAIIGSRPASTYFLLRRLLDSGQQPKALLIDYEPRILKEKPTQAIHESAELFDLRDCIDLAMNVRDYGYSTELLSSLLVPSYRPKHSIVDALKRLIVSKPESKPYEIAAYFRNWQKNRGQSLMSPQGAGNAWANNALAWREIIRSKDAWSCDPVNALYVARLLNLADSKGIMVYWLITPTHPKLQQELELAGIDGAYAQLAKSFQARNPNLIVVDARHCGYDEHKFMDGSHLNRHGSEAYSAALGRLLASNKEQPICGKRWIKLEQFSEPEEHLSLEDVEQSYKSVQLEKSVIQSASSRPAL